MNIDDALAWIITVIVGTILMFFLPFILFFGRIDQLVQSNVNAYTITFVDNAKVTGKITKENYEKYIRNLDSTGYSFDVLIEHESAMVVPEYDSDSNPTGNYLDTTMLYTKEEITEQLYDELDGKYEMKLGDHFSVQLISRKETMSNKLFKALLQMDLPLTKIACNYGGSILNDPQ